MYLYYLYFSEATRCCFLSRPVPLCAVSFLVTSAPLSHQKRMPLRSGLEYCSSLLIAEFVSLNLRGVKIPEDIVETPGRALEFQGFDLGFTVKVGVPLPLKLQKQRHGQ